MLVVIIFPLLQLYYCFVSAFYRFNCIETVKCIQKNLNFSYRYLIFYISGKKRKRDREFKGPIADRYICTLFLSLFYTRYWLDYLPLSPICYHPLWPSLVNSQPTGFLVDLFFNFCSIIWGREKGVDFLYLLSIFHLNPLVTTSQKPKKTHTFSPNPLFWTFSAD